MNQPSTGVKDHVAPDTLTEELPLDSIIGMVQQDIDINFLVFFTRAGLPVSEEDLKRLSHLSHWEVQRMGYYFNLLAFDGLFPRHGELTDEEGSRFLFMTQEEKPAWEAKLKGLKAQRESQRARDQLTEPDTRNTVDAPTREPRARVKPRSSYISPSREGRIAVAVQLDPALKEDLDKAVGRSGVTQQEYLTALIQYAVKEPTQQAEETLDLSKEALVKTHEAEEAIRRLTQTLSSRLR